MRDIFIKKQQPTHQAVLQPEKKESISDKKATPKKKSSLWLWIFLFLIIIICLPIGWYFFCTNVAIGNSDKNIAFEITEGETTFDIAENLKEKGFIRDIYSFLIYVYLYDIKLIPGIYYLHTNMNIAKLVEPISKGKIKEYKVTIIEGWRREEIAEMLAKNKITTQEEFMKASEKKEGYLFPDTYRFSIDIKAGEIVEKLIENFYKRTEGLNVSQDDLILASIIEREAKKDEDRAKIAGVFKNRLDAEMKLEADPTVQYAKGNWGILKLADYDGVKSPYNTYLYKGLPPGPICNPGLASIKAAVNPEKNDYYYFLHLDDGTTLYAKTLEEHNLNKQKKK